MQYLVHQLSSSNVKQYCEYEKYEQVQTLGIKHKHYSF